MNTKTAITALGIANPPYIRPQHDAVELIATGFNLKPAETRLLKSVYKATGIEKRHSVLRDFSMAPGKFEFFPNHPDTPFPATAARMKIYKEHAIHLALAAIENCIAPLENFDHQKISHLITVSCTGMYAPGIDIEIVQTLKLNTHTQRTAINFMGCYGAFTAIKLADAICKADPHATVLIVCVEICTIHFQKSMSLDNVFANSIFADGAAALVLQAQPAQGKSLTLESFHCELVPQTNQSIAWAIADSGFDIALSSYVPEIINAGIENFTHHLLQQNGLTLDDIDFFAIHPGGIKILQACEAALQISKEHNKFAYQILRDYGNMSSATIIFVLKTIWDLLTIQDHHKNIYSCAFGPGLTLESMLLKTHC